MKRLRPSGRVRAGLCVVLVACALLLPAARVFTCIVTLEDDPTSFLVLKRRPSLATTVRAGNEPLRRDYVLLDDDENELAYEAPYLFLMEHAFALGGVFLLAGGAVLAFGRGRR